MDLAASKHTVEVRNDFEETAHGSDRPVDRRSFVHLDDPMKARTLTLTR